VIGNEIFVGELVRDNANDVVDWRFGPQKWLPHVMPSKIEAKLRNLLRCLNLYTGSIDLRLNADGEYVFLEINPGGQFLFLEVDAGHPVTECLAEFLMNPARWPTLGPGDGSGMGNG
jgi:hypothetical protein